MSIVYCHHCDQHIDLDFDVEHFDENENCIRKQEEEEWLTVNVVNTLTVVTVAVQMVRVAVVLTVGHVTLVTIV